MKLVVYGPHKRLGCIDGDEVIDLNYSYAGYLKSKGTARPYVKADAEVPSCLLSFIEEGALALEASKNALKHAKNKGLGPKGEVLKHNLSEVKIHAPLPSIGTRIVMAGANFYDHSADVSKMSGHNVTVEELKKQVKEGTYRAWGFWKQARNVVGPDEEVPYPDRTQRLDYEVEVGAVIGKQGKDVKEADGESYIYGYTILNDLSTRDGGGGGQDGIFFGKNFDSCAPMGPCIVTKDEIKDVYKLKMKQTINGVVRQNGSMESMIRPFPWWIQWITRDMSIYPGDIICGGTCAGTALDTSPRVDGKTKPDNFIKPGDLLEASVEGIGTLKTKIVKK
ncbi:fumarylacetoacetate hydrolase family protein [Candidatus Bathyarchaeota archaeon]|nr:fumarylacetoacetate hydrolase family protein [Candidatus Bathyarchaeota archaeon]